MVDPAVVSYVLSSFSSVGKILESLLKLRELKIEPTPEQYQHIEAAVAENIDNIKLGSSAIALSAIFSQGAIDAIKDEIDKIRERLDDTYRDPGLTNYEKDRQADYCRRDFCANLNRMKKHSGGTLPPDLQKEWDLNLCSTFKFI